MMAERRCDGIWDETDVAVYLRYHCDLAGGQQQWAARHKLSPQYVSDVLKRRRQPGPAMLHALGVRKVVTYERIR